MSVSFEVKWKRTLLQWARLRSLAGPPAAPVRGPEDGSERTAVGNVEVRDDVPVRPASRQTGIAFRSKTRIHGP